MTEVTVSSKHQIVVPREAREALRIKPGVKLQVVVRNDTVILLRKPRSAARALAGIARTPYPTAYLEQERRSW